MAWVFSTTSGVFIHNGTDRDFSVSGLASATPFTPQPMPSGDASYRIVSDTASNYIRIMVRASEDGRWGLESGLYTGAHLNTIDGGARTAGTLYGALVRYGQTPHTTGSKKYSIPVLTILDEQDISAIAVTTDRNLVTEVRISGGILTLYVKDTVTTVSYTLTESDYPHYDSFGFVSSIDGAIAKSPQVCALNPVVTSPSQITCIISNGVLFTVDAGGRPARKGIICGSGYTQVCAKEYDGQLYLVGGGLARIYNPATGVISLWGPSNGDLFWTVDDANPANITGQLPGAAAYPGNANRRLIGTTTATIIEVHSNRMIFAGMPEESRNFWGSRVGDPGDINTGAVSEGRAFIAEDEAHIGIAGSPITALKSVFDDYLVIGGEQHIDMIQGDPILDGAKPNRITSDVGICGKDAVTLVDGIVWCVTQQGLGRIPGQSTPGLVASKITHVNEDRLMALIARGSGWVNFHPKIVSDPVRNGLRVYFENKTPTGNATQFWYSHRTGGFFPGIYSVSVGPTAVGRVNSDVYIGTRDGHVGVYDNATVTDFGTKIHSFTPLTLIMQPTTDEATMVRSAVVTLSRDSSQVDLFWRQGESAEEAYNAPLASVGDKAFAGRNRYRRRFRGGAIVLAIDRPAVYSPGTWALEAIDVDAEPAGYVRKQAGKPHGEGHGQVSGSGSGSGSGFGISGSGSGSGSGGSGSGPLSGSGIFSGGGPPTSGSGVSSGGIVVSGITLPTGSGANSSGSGSGSSGGGTVSGSGTLSGGGSGSWNPSGSGITVSGIGGLPGGSGGTAGTVGANGWTILTPDADSRIAYVSSSVPQDTPGQLYTVGEIGGDPRLPNISVNPYASADLALAALAALGANRPDWVLFERGRSWDAGFNFATASGLSASHLFVFGAYGVGELPLIRPISGTAMFGNAAFAPSGRISFLAITDLHLKGDLTSFNSGIEIVGPHANVIIEGCVIEQFFDNITPHTDPGTGSAVTVRRCIVNDPTVVGLTGHCQNVIFGGITGITLEENVFDWGAANATTPTQYRHLAYIANTNTGVVSRRNICARCPGTAWQQRAGGTNEVNLYLANSLNLYMATDPNAIICRNNVVWGTTDSVVGLNQGINIEAIFSASTISVTGNICSGAASSVGGTTNCAGINVQGVAVMTVTDNIVYDWQFGGSGAAFQIFPTTPGPATNAITIQGNAFQLPNGGVVADITLVNHELFVGNDYFTSSTTPQFMVNGVVCTWSGGTKFTDQSVIVGDTSTFANIVSTYPDPTRTPATYMASLGLTATFAAFMTACLGQRRLTTGGTNGWDDRFTARAYINYKRAGFGMAPV